MRYRKYVNLFVFLFIVMMAFGTDYNPFNIETMLPSFPAADVKEDELYKEIKEKSASYEEEPQDAYIDRVWKKTSGRNGRKVNIEASYAKMKDSGSFDESKLVFETVSPKVHMEDLPASPIYRGHPEKNMVALMINVSWGEEYIPKMLSTLKENKVKATFFIEGKWAKENAELVEMIDQQGHVIGNHAYNHPDMARLSPEENVQQIAQTNQILTAIIDKKPVWFAPPSGSFNDSVVEAAHQEGMGTILWTVDTIDWKNPSVSVMINRVMGKIHQGATVLMHPTASTSEGLDQLIKLIKDKDYRLGTIDVLLSEDW